MLLHSCCGPCSSSVIMQLKDEFDITIFYYDPNIYPRSEYEKRLAAQRQLLDSLEKEGINIPCIDGGYDRTPFEELSKGHENDPEGGQRCHECYRFRMDLTASAAAENGFDIFTTTLSVSPYKNAELLNTIGNEMSEKYGVEYYQSNFKKKDGYLLSIRLSQKYGLYRQKWCGCEYSLDKDS
jgi:predicted adenine nucleotide alpha hydrolase (AANH) superfamily ATPase